MSKVYNYLHLVSSVWEGLSSHRVARAYSSKAHGKTCRNIFQNAQISSVFAMQISYTYKFSPKRKYPNNMTLRIKKARKDGFV
jgi:hypothetical protein